MIFINMMDILFSEQSKINKLSVIGTHSQITEFLKG